MSNIILRKHLTIAPNVNQLNLKSCLIFDISKLIEFYGLAIVGHANMNGIIARSMTNSLPAHVFVSKAFLTSSKPNVLNNAHL